MERRQSGGKVTEEGSGGGVREMDGRGWVQRVTQEDDDGRKYGINK